MKKFTALLLAALMLISLSACGSKNKSGDETTTVDYYEQPEAYVGEGFKTQLSTLVRTNLEIVENTAVNGRLASDEDGKVTDKEFPDYASLLALYQSVYSSENAEKLLQKSYTEKDGALYVKGSAKKEGTAYDIGTITIEVTEKTDETCTFTATVTKTSADGKQSEKTLDCTAVYENSMWLLEDMYY